MFIIPWVWKTLHAFIHAFFQFSVFFVEFLALTKAGDTQQSEAELLSFLSQGYFLSLYIFQ